MEMDFQAVANCFGYTLLQQLLSHAENAQEHMLELGIVMVVIHHKQINKKKIVGIIKLFRLSLTTALRYTQDKPPFVEVIMLTFTNV